MIALSNTTIKLSLMLQGLLKKAIATIASAQLLQVRKGKQILFLMWKV